MYKNGFDINDLQWPELFEIELLICIKMDDLQTKQTYPFAISIF